MQSRTDIELVTVEVTGTIVHHDQGRCDGRPCPFHAPSVHPLMDAPMHLRGPTLIERICPHGQGHPDPDSVAYLDSRGLDGYGVHACDGCCFNDLPSEAEFKSNLMNMSNTLEQP